MLRSEAALSSSSLDEAIARSLACLRRNFLWIALVLESRDPLLPAARRLQICPGI